MRSALAAALERQRQDPEQGIAALEERYPEADPYDAREGWDLAVPNIFTGVRPGDMDERAWRFTLEHLSSAYGHPAPPLDAVCREEFLTPVRAAAGSRSA
jgi:hypothetical protein